MREVVAGEQRWWHCQHLLEHAKAGKAFAYTSALTLAEVTGGKGKSSSILVTEEHQDVRELVRAFFENEYIVVVEAGRIVGELARQLIWDFPTLNSFDATHLASALDADCDVLYTYDTDLLKLTAGSESLDLADNGEVLKLVERTSIRILEPKWDQAVQTPLPNS